jgi:hypothetical protein
MVGAGSAAEVPTARGRRVELSALAGLLEAAQAGRSGVVVLRGEVGIGKTALLEHAIELASDFRLLRALGVESEMELAFASLHQLCAPMHEFVDRLPAPQRDALEITFGGEYGRGAGSLSRLPGDLEPPLRGRAGAPAGSRGSRAVGPQPL